MIKTKQQRRRNRRLADKAVPATLATALVSSVVHGSSKATVNFNSPVQIDPTSLPTTWTFGATPRAITGIDSATPQQIIFDLSGTVAASDPYVIGGFDPAARTTTGGYVGASTGTMT